MTKEQLEKEAEEKGREWERSVLPEREEDYVPYAPYYPYSKGYIAGAEPREKRIAELKAQIEKMTDTETMLKILKDRGVIRSWYYNGTYHVGNEIPKE